MIYYDPDSNYFYDSALFGARQIDGVDNPDCRLPPNASPVSDVRLSELRVGLSTGKMLGNDGNGDPLLVDPPEPQGGAKIKSQIQALEKSISDRRMREAVLGDADAIAYITDVNKQIATLREQLS